MAPFLFFGTITLIMFFVHFHQANAFHLSYSDTGLFGVYAEAKPGNAAKTLEIILKVKYYTILFQPFFFSIL
jgi:hypothetical protein